MNKNSIKITLVLISLNTVFTNYTGHFTTRVKDLAVKHQNSIVASAHAVEVFAFKYLTLLLASKFLPYSDAKKLSTFVVLYGFFWSAFIHKGLAFRIEKTYGKHMADYLNLNERCLDSEYTNTASTILRAHNMSHRSIPVYRTNVDRAPAACIGPNGAIIIDNATFPCLTPHVQEAIIAHEIAHSINPLSTYAMKKHIIPVIGALLLSLGYEEGLARLNNVPGLCNVVLADPTSLLSGNFYTFLAAVTVIIAYSAYKMPSFPSHFLQKLEEKRCDLFAVQSLCYQGKEKRVEEFSEYFKKNATRNGNYGGFEHPRPLIRARYIAAALEEWRRKQLPSLRRSLAQWNNMHKPSFIHALHQEWPHVPRPKLQFALQNYAQSHKPGLHV